MKTTSRVAPKRSEARTGPGLAHLQMFVVMPNPSGASADDEVRLADLKAAVHLIRSSESDCWHRRKHRSALPVLTRPERTESARIGRVGFSKTGKTLYYDGKVLQ